MRYIGTASWNIPKIFSHHFSNDYPILKRYSQVFNAVEINSSFYKDHMAKTYERWAEIVPPDFRFSIKLSRRFTHEQKMDVTPIQIQKFLQDVTGLGKKLGVLLIQLPPKQIYEIYIAQHFFDIIRNNYSGPIAFEPRHLSWVTDDALKIMEKFKISKVRADPEICPGQSNAHSLSYFRLHGSPEIYKSRYEQKYLQIVAADMKLQNHDTWCIFDNTTFGHATDNAVQLMEILNGEDRG